MNTLKLEIHGLSKICTTKKFMYPKPQAGPTNDRLPNACLPAVTAAPLKVAATSTLVCCLSQGLLANCTIHIQAVTRQHRQHLCGLLHGDIVVACFAVALVGVLVPSAREMAPLWQPASVQSMNPARPAGRAAAATERMPSAVWHTCKNTATGLVFSDETHACVQEYLGVPDRGSPQQRADNGDLSAWEVVPITYPSCLTWLSAMAPCSCSCSISLIVVCCWLQAPCWSL